MAQRYITYVLLVLVTMLMLGSVNMRFQGHDVWGYLFDIVMYVLPLITVLIIVEHSITRYTMVFKKR